MISFNIQRRYRSIKYSISSTHLCPHNEPIQYGRFSLSKQNAGSTQATNHHHSTLASSIFSKKNHNTQQQCSSLSKQKDIIIGRQNKIYNASKNIVTRNNLYIRRSKQQQNKQPEVRPPVEPILQSCELPKYNEFTPYQQYHQHLQSIIPTFPSQLQSASQQMKAIRVELHHFQAVLDRQLAQMEGMVRNGVTRFKKIMEICLKEHSKVVVNSRDRIKDTRQFYRELGDGIAGIDRQIRRLDKMYNS